MSLACGLFDDNSSAEESISRKLDETLVMYVVPEGTVDEVS
jgi:hypothetical protein